MKKYYKCRLCIYIKIENILYPKKIYTSIELFKVKNFIHGFLFTAMYRPENIYKYEFCKHIYTIINEEKKDYKPLDFYIHSSDIDWFDNKCIHCNLNMILFGGYYNLKSLVRDDKKTALLHYGSLLDDIINYN